MADPTMADPNNIPQDAKQLSEDLESKDEETQGKAKSEVAKTDFDKEYEIAVENETNAGGTQSSDSNPVTRKTEARASGQTPTAQGTKNPGDSDPADYLDMAKDITKDAEAADS